MTDETARNLDALLSQSPGWEFERIVVKSSELATGERADISWIQTESVDRQKDVILTAGLDDEVYKANPVITLNHDYTREPIGKSVWRRKVRENGLRGTRSKTVYPARPEGWTENKAWGPDAAWALVRSGLMQGKSIGFITTEASPPTEEEVKRNPDWASARRIVRKAKLIEIAACWLPVNAQCLVEAVSKSMISVDGLKALGIPFEAAKQQENIPPLVVSFTTQAEVEASIYRAINSIDINVQIEQAIKRTLDKTRGRV